MGVLRLNLSRSILGLRKQRWALRQIKSSTSRASCRHFQLEIGRRNAAARKYLNTFSDCIKAHRPRLCNRLNLQSLQIAPSPFRPQYVKTHVRVHYYPDNSMAIFRGPRDIGRYLAAGELHGEVKIERREASNRTHFVSIDRTSAFALEVRARAGARQFYCARDCISGLGQRRAARH